MEDGADALEHVWTYKTDLLVCSDVFYISFTRLNSYSTQWPHFILHTRGEVKYC
jgi:hypothetical protein